MYFLCLVDRAPPYNLVKKKTWRSTFSWYVHIYQSLYVSGDYGPIIRRKNRVYATLCTCSSVLMTVWYIGAYDPAYQEEKQLCLCNTLY